MYWEWKKNSEYNHKQKYINISMRNNDESIKITEIIKLNA